MTRPLQAALGLVLVLGAGAIGFGAYRYFAQPAPQPVVASAEPADSQQNGPASVAGAASGDAEAEDGSALAAGSPMPEKRPEFSLRDRDGRVRSITEWDGKSLVINFWATWCAPCRREIPMLNALHVSRAPQNVEVIGVAVDFRERVLEYVRDVAIDYPLLIGEQDGLDALASFGINSAGFPLTVFTDDEGRIVTAHLGELHAAEADMILDVVADLNAGRIALDTGQQRIRTGLETIKKNAKSAS